jgi:RHS repeat-associated protein
MTLLKLHGHSFRPVPGASRAHQNLKTNQLKLTIIGGARWCKLALGLGAMLLAVTLTTPASASSGWLGENNNLFSNAKSACDSYLGSIFIETYSMYPATAPNGGPAYYCNLKHFLGSIYHYNAKVYPVCDPDRVMSLGGPEGCMLLAKYAACDECKSGKEGSGSPKPGQTPVADPVSIPSGNMYDIATDFESAGPNILRFYRYYSSYFNGEGTLGWSWRHNFSGHLEFPNGTTVKVHHANGAILTYVQSGSSWVPSDPDITYRLEASGANWKLIRNTDTVETYDSTGRLVSIQERSGYAQTLTYNGGGELTTVTDTYGRQLSFTYANGLVQTMTDPDAKVYSFTYGDLYPMPGGNTPILKSVIYPDGTPGDTNDNPRVSYLYEIANFPGALTGIVDERGNRTATFDYDSTGRAILSEGAGGANRHDIVYNLDGTVTVTSPLGRDEIYSFATHANAPKVTEIAGQATANVPADTKLFTYDANGFLASKTDPKGFVTTYTRDARGLELSRTEASGTAQARAIATTWHSGFRLPTLIVEPRKTTALTYDASGRLIQRTETDTTSHSVPYSTNGQTRTWTYTWYANGLLESVDGPRTDLSDETEYTYTAAGALATVTNALSQVTSVTAHNGRGLPLSITDPNGIVTELAYDARGRLTEVTVNPGVGEAVTGMAYDAAGNLVSMTLPDGATLAYEYDSASRLTAIENGAGERIEYNLDAMGHRTAEAVKANGGAVARSQSWVFDELGRLLRHLGAASQQTEYAYDLNGNTVSVTDPLSRVTQNAFDALNRLIRVTDPLLGDTDYGFDAQDNLDSVTDPVGLTTSYVTDGFGRRIQTASPDTGTTVYDYDPAGNVVSMTDARGVVTDFTYDALNRVLTRTYPADPTQNVSYSYDDTFGGNYGIGRLTGIADTTGTTALTYDVRGNVTQESRSIGSTVYDTAYAYDKADRLTGITYPSGRIVGYLRDDLGRVEAVTTQADALSPAFVVASRIAYRPFGPIESLVFGNGLEVALAYDSDGRLTGIETGAGSPSVQDLTYAYDLAGNIVTIADALNPARSQSFDYDALDRLKEADGAYGLISYAYDAVGNRTERSIDDGLTLFGELYSYDAFSNRLLSVTPTLGPTRSFTYLPSGQVETDDAGPVAPSDFTYDLSGRLTGVSQSSFPVAAYKHNALGQRLVKDLNGPVTHYHYDRGGELIAESDDLGNVAREYLHLDGLPLAIIEPGGSGPVTTDIVIDNTDPGASGLGPWSSEIASPDYYGVDYDARVGGDGSGHFDWVPTLPGAGQYQVYARWPDLGANEGSTAHYTVTHGGGTTNLSVDQRQGSNGWALLGTFPMAPGAGHGLSLSDLADVGVVPGGTGASAGDEYVVDNTDPGTSAVGSWTSGTLNPGFYGTNFQYYAAGGGANTFTWFAPITQAGRYKVYARWTVHANRATNAPYTVHHDGGTTTVQVNQEGSNGVWVPLGSYNLTPGAGHKVVLSNNANEYVIADAVRFAKDPIASGASEIVIDNTDPGASTQGSWSATSWGSGYYGTNIRYRPAGSGANTFTWTPSLTDAGRYKVYAFWQALSDRPTNAPYTVHHDGGATTVLANQKQSGGQWNLLGSFNLTPGNGHKVVLSDNANGVTIADAVRFVRDSSVTGSGEQTVDNNDAGASAVGTWTPWTGGSLYYGADVQYRAAGTGANSFTWSVPAGISGRTKVYARWTTWSNHATNAPYTIHHAGGTTTVRVNQQLNNGTWTLLGSFALLSGLGHKVVLSDDANGIVIADAVRFVVEAGGETIPRTVAADAVRFVSNDAELPLYVHADHLATPQKMTDQAASLVWDKVQWPFGETFSVSGASTNPKRFPGQLHDPETGFHYNYFRDYDPTTGRYLQSDPILQVNRLVTDEFVSLVELFLQDPSQLHPYVYVLNNPANFSDPAGLGVWSAIKCKYYSGKLDEAHEACKKECPPDVEGMLEFVEKYGTNNMLGEAMWRCTCQKAGPDVCKKWLESCGTMPY